MREIFDIHTHILPEIDDGAKNWDTCLEMISQSWDFGVRGIIATPHYLPWKECVAGEVIRSLCGEAERRARDILGKPMKVYPGNELYYHTELVNVLNENRVLTLAGSRYILVEFAVDVPYGKLYQGLSRLRMEQYRPILAHTERYRCLRKEGRLEEIKKAGALIQMNYEAFQKGVLDETGRWSRQRLIGGEVDFVASDMHNLTSRQPFGEKNMSWLHRKLPEKYVDILLMENAKKICTQ